MEPILNEQQRTSISLLSGLIFERPAEVHDMLEKRGIRLSEKPSVFEIQKALTTYLSSANDNELVKELGDSIIQNNKIKQTTSGEITSRSPKLSKYLNSCYRDKKYSNWLPIVVAGITAFASIFSASKQKKAAEEAAKAQLIADLTALQIAREKQKQFQTILYITGSILVLSIAAIVVLKSKQQAVAPVKAV